MLVNKKNKQLTNTIKEHYSCHKLMSVSKILINYQVDGAKPKISLAVSLLSLPQAPQGAPVFGQCLLW